MALISVKESKQRTSEITGMAVESLTHITEEYLALPVYHLVEPNDQIGKRYGYNMAVIFSDELNDYAYMVQSSTEFGAISPEEACGGRVINHFSMRLWDHFTTSTYCNVRGQPNVHHVVIGFELKS
ncbi:hypothetical protein [Pedobacter hiemivivus]|uniref:Uncharacterized protein n=1 Tax=Pedobacter hiemivivus TaxID=2530454 RepID=A0A4R0NGH8_9SPHI|nr:hypothetical protein [Pedobacter hiemivivus]TCC99545.1 hypothetical protein EZ444_02390 [Pedobacter hiemivivus]